MLSYVGLCPTSPIIITSPFSYHKAAHYNMVKTFTIHHTIDAYTAIPYYIISNKIYLDLNVLSEKGPYVIPAIFM